MSEQSNFSNTTELSPEACVEALLFVSAGSVHLQSLSEVLEKPIDEIEQILESLELKYQATGGLRIQRHAGRIQLTTAPELAPLVERFLGLEATARLSKAALETLAIVAYRQPITRPGIDAVRGVNSDGVVKSLLMKGLIQEIGRTEGPGRPILYGTTSEFLQHFGFSSLTELPPYDVVTEEENPPEPLLKD